MPKYMRSNSVRPDPHEKLLEAVKKNNLCDISNLLRLNKGLLTEEYRNGLSILEMAVFQLADVVQVNTIRELLKSGADPKRSFSTWDSKSAIHFATMGQNPEILELIASDPNVEINATTQGRNALHILIIDGDPTKKFEDCVRVLCRQRIDFQWRDYKSKRPIYYAARKKYASTVKILLSQNNHVTTEEAALLDVLNEQLYYVIDNSETTFTGFDYLRRKDENGFITWYNQQKDVMDDQEKSYLQLACERNLVQVAKFLIEKNPNEVGSANPTHPFTIAVRNGYYQLVELFLNASGLEVPQNILNEVMKHADLDGNKNIDYGRSCKLLVNHGGFDVNERDPVNGLCPLHYAVKYAGKSVVSELLHQKASLANRDCSNYLTIQDIDHDTLKDHFDSCIEAHPADPKDHSREAMYLTFDFTTLLPTTSNHQEDTLPDCEINVLHKKRVSAVKETDAILNMTKDVEQKPLLLHPLIVTFLYAKWHRVRFLFLANLIIYLLFCASLLWFIFSNYNEPNKVPVDLAFVALFITTLLISLREAFQIAFMFRKYFQSTDNYVEVALLLDIYVLLFSSSTDHQRRPMFAIAVLLAALELLFLFGSAPGMSTYIVMLRTVSFNFIKFLLFNAILILAFAFSFYTLFRKTEEDPSEKATTTKTNLEEDKAKEDSFFKSIYLATFKTLIMLTGEFEAGDLDFDQYPMFSHLIFIFFVFLIAIILLNLLNGLAVSDTQEIKNEAKLIALVTRAQYVAHIEATVFDNVLSDSCTSGFNFVSTSMKQAWQKWMLNRICISQNLDDGTLKVLPNQDGRMVWKVPVSNSCNFLFGGNKLHEGTVKMAKTIVTERHASDTANDTKYDELLNMMIEIKLALSNADLM